VLGSLETIEKLRGRLLGDADRAVALNVRVAPYGTQSGSGASDIPAQEREIRELLHCLGTTAVLRDPHAVDQDGALIFALPVRPEVAEAPQLHVEYTAQALPLVGCGSGD
jgi:hypothetical protein